MRCRAWQSRPLDAVWPVIYLDALVIKVRDQGVVQNKAAYLALGMGVSVATKIEGRTSEKIEGRAQKGSRGRSGCASASSTARR